MGGGVTIGGRQTKRREACERGIRDNLDVIRKGMGVCVLHICMSGRADVYVCMYVAMSRVACPCRRM